MTAPYLFLNEDFNQHSGAITGYFTTLSGGGTNYIPQSHYNIRSFHSDHLTVSRTMNDMSFWNVGFFQGITMQLLNLQTIQGSNYIRTQASLDLLNQSTLNMLNQTSLENQFVDNEQWTLSMVTSGTTMTLQKYSAWRYTDLLTISLSGVNPSGTLTSTYNDDILTDFNVTNQNYYIEMILRRFPGQTAIPITLDLNNSLIEFSSDTTGNFDSTQTDTIPFSASLIDLTTADFSDVTFRISRNSLVKSTLNALKYIRMRLKAIGTGQLNINFQSMRMYPQGLYNFPVIDVDTKRGRFTANLGASGTISNITQPDSGLLIFNPSRPKNLTQITKLNSGHLPPPASGTNQLDLYYRYVSNPNNSVSNIDVTYKSTTSQTQLIVTEIVSGTQNILKTSTGGILTAETDYYLKTELLDSSIRTSILNYNSLFLPITSVLTTDWVTLKNPPRRGYVAYDFKPYNYDFVVDYIRLQEAEFGTFQSKVFPSYTPLKGAKLISNSSPTIDLINTQTFTSTGDSSVTTGTPVGLNVASDAKITRTGMNWYGGHISTSPVDIGDTEFISISGYVFPYTGFRGNLRIALLNQDGLVGFLTTLTGIINNQWNYFTIPIRVINLAPEQYSILFHEAGFFNDTFELASLQLNQLTISWYATADNSLWHPFYDKINNEWAGINFVVGPGRSLAVKAIALSDQSRSWIESYTAIPIYGSQKNP